MKFIHIHYDIIQPEWKVLHVGGGRQPFRRANFVIDSCSWSERNKANSWVQAIPEYFSENTWYTQSLEEIPWPFSDEEFDYVIIDDVIVQSRDPIAICREMERVAKRGYIEFPNVITQHLRGVESPNYTGYGNHRWFADVKNNAIRFSYKHPSVHGKKEFWIENPHLSVQPWINPTKAVDGIFWDTSIECYEDYEISEFPDWFFEENIWKYKEQTANEQQLKTFWKIDEPVPVMLETSPFQENTLVHINNVPFKFAISMLTNKNERHVEMLKFEHFIVAKNKQPV